jgi:16S rRNA U516 pseudouridylate synthase RsuA-like enzyme
VIGQHTLLEKEYVVGVREPPEGAAAIEPQLEQLRSGLVIDGRALKDAQVRSTAHLATCRECHLFTFELPNATHN